MISGAKGGTIQCTNTCGLAEHHEGQVHPRGRFVLCPNDYSFIHQYGWKTYQKFGCKPPNIELTQGIKVERDVQTLFNVL